MGRCVISKHENRLNDSPCAVREEGFSKDREAVLQDGGSGLPHRLKVKVNVVSCDGHVRENLTGFVQVSQVRARKPRTSCARAFFIQRDVGVGVGGLFDADVTVSSEGHPVATVARGKDTVKHVDPHADTGDEIVWGADPHQVAGLVLW